MAISPQPVDFNYFLARKYAILQQQADATTQNANSSAVASAAAAAVDRTRAGLMPAESAAQIAQQGAQTRLLGEQAAVVRPESAARIASMNAETALTGTNNQIAIREGLTPRPILGSSLNNVLGSRGYTGFRLSDDAPLPRRRQGESEIAYMDRINGL